MPSTAVARSVFYVATPLEQQNDPQRTKSSKLSQYLEENIDDVPPPKNQFNDSENDSGNDSDSLVTSEESVDACTNVQVQQPKEINADVHPISEPLNETSNGNGSDSDNLVTLNESLDACISSTSKTALIARPRLTGSSTRLEGFVLYFEIGVDSSRVKLFLENRRLTGYGAPQKLHKKVEIDLSHLVSIESVPHGNVETHGYSYWFQVVLSIPQEDESPSNTGHRKDICLRKTYTFAVQDESDRTDWMMNIVKSVTEAFPENCLVSIVKVGWCYTKATSSPDWTGAWLLLMENRCIYIRSQHYKARIDLKKVSSIEALEPDGSIRSLLVETGPIVAITSALLPTVFLIMETPHDTLRWKHFLEMEAYKNGRTLNTQQLTEKNVPVLVERCIDFLYSYGSLSTELFRKPGSESKVERLLKEFRKNAYTVRLSRNEVDEHDVAEVLRRSLRDIPNSFFSGRVFDLISTCKLTSVNGKLANYEELLLTMSCVEYNSLKMLVGFLRFLNQLKTRNNVDITALAQVWDETLLVNYRHTTGLDSVVLDLITLYEQLFKVTREEQVNEQQMLTALEMMQAAEEELQRSLSDDRVYLWVKVDLKAGEKLVKVEVTEGTKALDVVKVVASAIEVKWDELLLFEVIDGGRLSRLIHLAENVLEITERWRSWPSDDVKGSWLKVSLDVEGFFSHVKQPHIVIPSTLVCYADQRTEELKKHELLLVGNQIMVSRMDHNSEVDVDVKATRIDLTSVFVFLGCESRRSLLDLRWAITLVDRDFKARSEEFPYIGHVFGGKDLNDQTTWHANILRNIFRDDIRLSQPKFGASSLPSK